MAGQGAVNQRLYCCRLQLDYYQQLLDQAELPISVVSCLAGEAALYHLQAAYKSYLKELAAAYNQPQLDPLSANGLAEVIQTAEINELASLERSSDSWLSEILNFSQSAPAEKRQGVIASVTASTGNMDLTRLASIFLNLQQLIERQRGLSQEW
jgi:uncharacterized damage-inducible protein DinB